jgi:hypothetical protein
MDGDDGPGIVNAAVRKLSTVWQSFKSYYDLSYEKHTMVWPVKILAFCKPYYDPVALASSEPDYGLAALAINFSTNHTMICLLRPSLSW